MENSDPRQIRSAAVIEIGSTGIRLLLIEYNSAGEWRILDQSGKPVTLGRDVFTSGVVSRESFLECLSVLQGFSEQLGAWGINKEDVRVIATSAVRAARNREIFIDRLRRETGLDIAIIEGIEENRLMYLAVRYALKNDLPQFWRSNSMILDVGGGSTEIMLLRRGKMVAAHSLKLGTILMDQKVRQGTGSARFIERYLNENVRNTQEFLNDEMDLSNIKTLAAAGSDARQAARHIGRDLNEHCRIISRDDFYRFIKSVENLSMEECIRRLEIPYADADGFVPGLMIYRTFMERLAAEELAVPGVSVREGWLIGMVRGIDRELQDDFYSQISASALSLGRKYRFDEAHSRHVAELSLVLFDALTKEHGMNSHERMLLETAALLHDIGVFIRRSHHQEHGQYIVANSEIFGLKQEELDIIGNVIRYHRDELPSSTDIQYIALQREERILVLKMAAILRAADALDRGHSRRIKDITVEKREETLILHSGGTEEDGADNSLFDDPRTGYRDFSLEQMGLKEKADLFQDVFGYKVILT
ncbi:MAG: HD domain-containing protein [Spirochaetaceae bacterium]|jgi:exopolyphosphatase/guanosine-5'-triphosphate,3'-diphosphate pyrophosphatase|nr:HD domain-containing protein [Spirochaetaceae bacterium]